MSARSVRREEGTMTAFVVILSLALLMLAGLVYDGGRILAARREAYAVAANAARVGAQAVDVEMLRAGGAVRLDATAARQAALDHLARTGQTGQVTVTGATIQVTVLVDVPMVLLGAVGLASRTVEGTGTAELVRGITGPEGG